MKTLLLIALFAVTCHAETISGILAHETSGTEGYLAIKTNVSKTFGNEIISSKSVQIAGLSPQAYKAARAKVGQYVVVTGQLFPPETVHHHTNLIVITDTVTAKKTPNKPKQTIGDYFLMLPNTEFLEGTPAELLNRALKGEPYGNVDIKNGYMEINGDGAQVSLQVALFRYENGEPLLAIAYGKLEEKDYTILKFYRQENGKLVEADIPFPLNKNLGNKQSFCLPRYGRLIEIMDAKYQPIAGALWNGTAFIREINNNPDQS